MRLKKTIFVVSLVVLVLPADARQRMELGARLDQAAQYVDSLCERNTKACASGSHYWIMVKKKSASSFRLARSFAWAQLAAGPEGAGDAGGSDGKESEDGQLPDELSALLNRGTLRPGDLMAPWRGQRRSSGY